eukprot:9949699-Alexandrium_andersonii.AAC.1
MASSAASLSRCSSRRRSRASMIRASCAGFGWARASEATSTSSPPPRAQCSPAPSRGCTRASATTPSSSRSAGAY